MNIQRGDVLKARFPHASGERGKKRPVVVVQADIYNMRLRHAVVAEVTGNLDGKGDPACLFIDSSTSESQAADCLRSTSWHGLKTGYSATPSVICRFLHGFVEQLVHALDSRIKLGTFPDVDGLNIPVIDLVECGMPQHDREDLKPLAHKHIGI